MSLNQIPLDIAFIVDVNDRCSTFNDEQCELIRTLMSNLVSQLHHQLPNESQLVHECERVFGGQWGCMITTDINARTHAVCESIIRYIQLIYYYNINDMQHC